MDKLKELQLILDEVLEDYGWSLRYNLDDTNKIDTYKKDFIRLFSEKCCGGLILENSDESSIIKRIQNV